MGERLQFSSAPTRFGFDVLTRHLQKLSAFESSSIGVATPVSLMRHP
jgi:hypothetical protein